MTLCESTVVPARGIGCGAHYRCGERLHASRESVRTNSWPLSALGTVLSELGRQDGPPVEFAPSRNNVALVPGTRLGPYAITGPVVAGGMGEVYKATDTRLVRTVAVKCCPSTSPQIQT